MTPISSAPNLKGADILRTLTEQDFIKQVSNHQMTVVKNDGAYRHVAFKKPGSICGSFDLITWPGYLCYCGDMGTYVFRRLTDMFEFFRHDYKVGDPLYVNCQYWSEKVESQSKFGNGCIEYSEQKFISAVKERVADHIKDNELSEEDATELLNQVRAFVLSESENEHAAFSALNDFECGDFQFTDFFESNLTDYTQHFRWCCYAISWGIREYDGAQETAIKPTFCHKHG